MRKGTVGLNNIKNAIAKLVGKKVKVSVNYGRNRVVRYNGTVLSAYPSLFLIAIDGEKAMDRLTASYADVLTGDVKLKRV